MLAAAKKGGELACFESREEYRFVLELIEKEGKINGFDAWCADCRKPGEPNLVYNSRPETIAMMYYKSAEARWAWYDASATFRNSKKTYGYIIEYGN